MDLRKGFFRAGVVASILWIGFALTVPYPFYHSGFLLFGIPLVVLAAPYAVSWAAKGFRASTSGPVNFHRGVTRVWLCLTGGWFLYCILTIDLICAYDRVIPNPWCLDPHAFGIFVLLLGPPIGMVGIVASGFWIAYGLGMEDRLAPQFHDWTEFKILVGVTKLVMAGVFIGLSLYFTNNKHPTFSPLAYGVVTGILAAGAALFAVLAYRDFRNHHLDQLRKNDTEELN